MCSIEAYGRLHSAFNDDGSSGGGRPLSNESKTDALTLPANTLNFIETWIK